jgi:hypothetical protein
MFIPIVSPKEWHVAMSCHEVRTLVEGSTVVMQAINTNIEKNLKKAGREWAESQFFCHG